MTDIDWTQPIELETNPPKPAKVVSGPDSEGDYAVEADWHGLGNLTLIVNASGRVLGCDHLSFVRNVAPATDARDELIAELVAWLKRCEEMVSTDKGPPDWDMVRAVIAKAEVGNEV